MRRRVCALDHALRDDAARLRERDQRSTRGLRIGRGAAGARNRRLCSGNDAARRAEHVFGGDASVRAAAPQRANVDAVFARQAAHGRRGGGIGCGGRGAVPGRGAARGRGRRGFHACRGRCGIRRGRRGAEFVDDGDRRAGRDRLSLFDQELADRSGDRRGDTGVDLVGGYLDEVFVLVDRVADLFEPLRDGAFGHRLAELRHRYRRGHQNFTISRIASAISAGDDMNASSSGSA